MRITSVLLGALLLVTAMTTESRGALMLYMSAGGDSYTINDNDALDADPTVGIIAPVFTLTQVGDFALDPTLSSVTFGGGLNDAHLDVHLNITYLPGSSAYPGSQFTVMATSTDVALTNGLATLKGEMGGTTSPAIGAGNIQYYVAFDGANVPFSFPVGTTLGPVAVGGAVYNQDVQANYAGPTLFSLSFMAQIDADAQNQNIVFDAGPIAVPNASEVPEPASMGVWALIVTAGMGFYRRRRCERSA